MYRIDFLEATVIATLSLQLNTWLTENEAALYQEMAPIQESEDREDGFLTLPFSGGTSASGAGFPRLKLFIKIDLRARGPQATHATPGGDRPPAARAAGATGTGARTVLHHARGKGRVSGSQVKYS